MHGEPPNVKLAEYKLFFVFAVRFPEMVQPELVVVMTPPGLMLSVTAEPSSRVPVQGVVEVEIVASEAGVL